MTTSSFSTGRRVAAALITHGVGDAATAAGGAIGVAKARRVERKSPGACATARPGVAGQRSIADAQAPVGHARSILRRSCFPTTPFDALGAPSLVTGVSSGTALSYTDDSHGRRLDATSITLRPEIVATRPRRACRARAAGGATIRNLADLHDASRESSTGQPVGTVDRLPIHQRASLADGGGLRTGPKPDADAEE